ncbi:MAG: asparagine synthase (glutamine-hydrolyzing) [Candidatus Calescibacterium sp.]|nr:asparagine synthase (glutamine-hydrolyzing) [Candidatus Calescibacterium sp.]MDW8087247.1 asparagine synthase (glutamine-hydrolyzing) [Candidatus Calescibacterium sp.]
MCRIAGFWDLSFNGEYDINKTIKKMTDSLAHGGPDHEGKFTIPNIGLAIGYRRLAIIDLSERGNQPMTDGRFWIVFNGEIYNFSEIRKELQNKGYSFRSSTDTETILYSFREWGIDCVSKFSGMWAFAIWDNEERKLILCRDRFGVKPLYWYFKDNLFMFSSELKSFHFHPKFKKELDLQALDVFFFLGCIVSPKSIFKNSYKLEPSHFLTIDNSGNIEKKRYYDIRKFYRVSKIREDQAEQELTKIMKQSFKLRMVSDVPVGVFLSGGVDSSLVCALLSEEGFKLKTFTIGSKDEHYDESKYAREVSRIFGTDHTEFIIDFPSAEEVVYRIPEIYDEPFADSSAIPTYTVSMLARKSVKVALSADGGDELFIGYPKYLLNTNLISVIGMALRIINPELLPGKLKRIVSKLQLISYGNSIEEKYIYSNICFLPKTLEESYLNRYNSKDSLKYITENYSLDSKADKITKVQMLDFMTIFPDTLLMKVDRASMAVALEVREPFLDNKIAEFSLTLPLNLKLRKNTTKYILRKILLKYLPEKLVFRRKMGFSIPIEKWEDTNKILLSILSPERIKKTGVLNYKKIEEIFNLYKSDKKEFSRLWYLSCFQLWAEKYLI